MPDAPTIISLTSIPPRFDQIGAVLLSLVQQDLPADAIHLNIPRHYQRFADWDGTLPDVPNDVTIRRCDQDWGPATKVVPSLAEFAGQDVDVLWCDDDSIYAPDWHLRFKALRRERPTEALAAIGRHLPGVGSAPRPQAFMPRMRRLQRPAIQAHRAELGWQAHVPLIESSGYADLLSGWGGVMAKPAFFSPMVFDGPGAHWPVDDPWLSAMLTLAGTKIWVESSILPPGRLDLGGVEALFLADFDGGGRKDLDDACIAFYRETQGLWSEASLRPEPTNPLRRAFRRILG